MKNKQKLVELIKKYVAEPYKKLLEDEIKPSIRLKTNGFACKKIGTTKLGGCPDLLKGMSWPRSEYDGRYLSFLGQINLEEVYIFDEQALLPKTGILYFFFDLNSADDGKVIFVDEIKALEKAAAPKVFKEQKQSFLKRLFTSVQNKSMLKESQVEIYKEYNIPSWDSLHLERIQKITNSAVQPINAYDEGFIDAIYEAGETESTSNHHLLGNYKGIQNEYHELSFIDRVDSFEKIELTEIESALKWKLLFQFDSDDHLEMNWGDWGKIYFFIKEEDLKNRNFDQVKISADCY